MLTKKCQVAKLYILDILLVQLNEFDEQIVDLLDDSVRFFSVD